MTPEARERTGWVFYDWANQVFQTSVVTVFLSLYLTGVTEAAARASGQPCTGRTALVDCNVSLFGVDVAAGSVYGYLISLATLLQVLVLAILIVQFVAFGGAVLHGRLAARFGAKRTVLGSLVGWTAVVCCAYALTPGAVGPFLAVGVGIGVVLGGTLALTRSMFSQLIPAGREAEYFSLYEIGEKGTSWLGPLLFATVADVTGSFRPAIVSLVVFFVVGGVALAFVPMRRAIRAAGNEQPLRV